MSNYNKSTNFAVKDSLTTGNPAKAVKGTEIDDEFNAISSAISSKADTASPALTGTPTAPTATSGTNTTQVATTAFVKGEIDSSVSSTQALTNKTINLTNNTITGTLAEFNIAVSDANLASLTGSETLTNKTIDIGSNTVSGTKAQFNTAVTDTDFIFNNDFTGSNQSLSTSGYQKLPGGLILQWGVQTVATNTRQIYSFPTSFPTAAVSFATGSDWIDANGYNPTGGFRTSATQFYLYNTAESSKEITWMAIGY